MHVWKHVWNEMHVWKPSGPAFQRISKVGQRARRIDAGDETMGQDRGGQTEKTWEVRKIGLDLPRRSDEKYFRANICAQAADYVADSWYYRERDEINQYQEYKYQQT